MKVENGNSLKVHYIQRHIQIGWRTLRPIRGLFSIVGGIPTPTIVWVGSTKRRLTD